MTALVEYVYDKLFGLRPEPECACAQAAVRPAPPPGPHPSAAESLRHLLDTGVQWAPTELEQVQVRKGESRVWYRLWTMVGHCKPMSTCRPSMRCEWQQRARHRRHARATAPHSWMTTCWLTSFRSCPERLSVCALRPCPSRWAFWWQGSESLRGSKVCGACMLTSLRGCWQWAACVQQAWGAMVLQETEQRQLLAQLSWLQRRGSVPAGCLRVSTQRYAMSDILSNKLSLSDLNYNVPLCLITYSSNNRDTWRVSISPVVLAQRRACARRSPCHTGPLQTQC